MVIGGNQPTNQARGARARGLAGAFRLFHDDLPTLAQCQHLLTERLPGPPVARRLVALGKARERVLAQDIFSEHDIPAFHRSTMDGYAVRSEAIRSADSGAGVTLSLIGNAPAGQKVSEPLGANDAFEVATGSMLPLGADTVVPAEFCRTTASDKVTVLRALPTGANILPRGADLRAGQLALAAGTMLKAAHIGVLATLGHTTVPVYPRPAVSVIATGGELVAPDEHPGPGQIRDSNTSSLAAALERDGAVVRNVGIVTDDLDRLVPRLKQELGRADIVLISGGSSVGKADLTRDAVSRLGADILFHGVKLKPGKPTLVGLCGETVVVGLPGNPVSALAIYSVLVRPMLRKRMGWRDPLQETTASAYLAREIRRTADREELVRVRLYRADGRLWAEPVPGSSGMLHSMSLSDGHVLITMDRMEYEEGELVEVRLFE